MERYYNRKTKNSFLLPIILCTASFAFLLIFPADSSSAVLRSLDMCSHSLIPSLFPFVTAALFCSNSGVCDIVGKSLEVLTKKIWGLGGCAGTVFILGAVSGYPVGAECAAKLYINGSCSKEEAECMAVFCNNAGPAYVIAGVGAALRGDLRVGIVMYISQIISAVIMGILLRFVCRRKGGDSFSAAGPQNGSGKGYMSLSEAFVASIEGAAYAMLRITAFIACFSVITAAAGMIFSHLGIVLSPITEALFCGLFEVTAGVSAAAEVGGYTGVVLTSFILTFSGISVTVQTLSPLKQAGLSAKMYIPGKFCQAIICSLITAVCSAAV